MIQNKKLEEVIILVFIDYNQKLNLLLDFHFILLNKGHNLLEIVVCALLQLIVHYFVTIYIVYMIF